MSKFARYPTISLPEAISRLRMIYESEGTNAADRDTMVLILGYNSMNGASSAVLAGISHYGLLDETDDKRVKISRRGLDILLGDDTDLERADSIRLAALEPKLFEELFTQFGGDKASDRNLQNYLIKKGFAPPSAVKAVKSYRETMNFVNEQTRNVLTEDNENSEDSTTQKTTPIVNTQPNPLSNFFSPPSDGRPSYRVGTDKYVQLSSSDNLTEEELEMLIQHLELEKRMLNRHKRTVDEDNNEDSN